MTDKDVLKGYRLKQAEETLFEAQKMLEGGFSPRTIINRAYYSMFYSILSLFLLIEINIKTSKHAGVISVFDKEFIHTGKIDKHYSQILHKTFDVRQESDYKEFVEQTADDASEYVHLAKDFLVCIKDYIEKHNC